MAFSHTDGLTGSKAEGEAVDEKEEKKCSTTVSLQGGQPHQCGVRTSHWQQGAIPRTTPKFDEMLFRQLPGLQGVDVQIDDAIDEIWILI